MNVLSLSNRIPRTAAMCGICCKSGKCSKTGIPMVSVYALIRRTLTRTALNRYRLKQDEKSAQFNRRR